MSQTKIAVSGDPGSFSEEAGLLYAQRENLEAKLLFATDMKGVLEAISKADAEIGIFPVVNSRGGLVNPAFHAMGQYTFQFIGEIWLEIYQCLMVLPGKTASDIESIASHPQAIRQCERHIRSHHSNAKIIEWNDTAAAARDLKQGKLSENTAVIAPARAAHIYELDLIEKGIQDNHPNLTTFIVVKKRL